MVNDDGAVFTVNFGQTPDQVLGKFEVADTPMAKTQWELFRQNPELFEFAVGYIPKKMDGDTVVEAELVEISLVVRKPNEQSNPN